ncbi:sterol desaturase family protein [Paenibacillus sp. FSL H7-0357]|uniref:sterol desaturase family protein n=1 Tax=Paenibacillus sp. FSL H7-0357 TaxID=1536774 RepID=UPI000690704B|nr:sterol desaturase family protein [Paenibacillus sp. FSL H7-0357]
MNHYEEFYYQPAVRFNVNMSFLGIALSFIYFDWIRTFAGLILGIFLFTVFEYFAHRYVHHHYALAVFKNAHLKHHHDSEDIQHLFFSNRVGSIYCLILTILLWLVVNDLSISTAMLTGILLYNFYAQWWHFVAHRPITPGTAWGRRMKDRHLWHHEENGIINFGVSQPYIDYLLGTSGTGTAFAHSNEHINHPEVKKTR